jgi:hypothetical protein
MNTSHKKKESDAAKSGHSPSSLQAEVASAPELAWFLACLKSAGIILSGVTAYLIIAKGLVLAWEKYIATNGKSADDSPGLGTWALAYILALPLILAYFFNVLPALRRRHERSLRPIGLGKPGYFTTAPREDDSFGLFIEGYSQFLEWTSAPKAPLLHLTGFSGSGKSSLIGAYLKPHLATMESGPKTIILTVRSYNDPLAALKDALLTLWRKEPADYHELSPIDALRRAARQLDDNKLLIVAFDQFEEFFLLRASGAEKGKIESETVAEPSAVVAVTELSPLRDFLHAFLVDPPARVTILLSYREDHRGLLNPLQLPALQQKMNWMSVDPLDFATAAKFLRSCPGLKVPDACMERVLSEAARQEGGRIVMRPIVANILGIILQRMSDHPTLWRQTDDLLRSYVRDCIGEELKEERGRVLRALLTDFRTARPRSVAKIASETGLDSSALGILLDHLGHAGLLRCVNASETDPTLRVWQIAHDFLATLIQRVLDGLNRTFWHTVRPWISPAMIVLLVLLLLPALPNAKEWVMLIQSANNLKKITSAVKVYVGENEAQFPKNLLALAMDPDAAISPKNLISPRDDVKIPHDFSTWPKKEQFQWINTNNDYFYIGAGRKNGETPTNILAFESFDLAGEKIPVVFDDGRVQLLWRDKARDLIEAQTASQLNGLTRARAVVRAQNDLRLQLRGISGIKSIYDAEDDFSIINGNPNGTWSYAESSTNVDSQQILYTQTTNDAWHDEWHTTNYTGYKQIPAVYRYVKDSGIWPANTLGFHPGWHHEVSHVIWTAPKTAAYSITSIFTLLDVGQVYVYMVLRSGGTTVNLSSNLLNVSSRIMNCSTNLNLNVGEKIDFAVAEALQTPDSDSTALAVVIAEHSN